MRAFVAIEIPEPVSRRLAALDPQMPGLRWTEAGRHHLTLFFFGRIDPAAADDLKTALERVRGGEFPLGLHGVGVFGGKRGRPLAIWAGIDDSTGALGRLHAAVAAAARTAGVLHDASRFRPHVTMGRAKRLDRAALRGFLDAHAEHDLGQFTVVGFTLFSSVLRPEGAEHHVEFRVTFDKPRT